jgi:hypothetical protein
MCAHLVEHGWWNHAMTLFEWIQVVQVDLVFDSSIQPNVSLRLRKQVLVLEDKRFSLLLLFWRQPAGGNVHFTEQTVLLLLRHIIQARDVHWLYLENVTSTSPVLRPL